MNKGIIISGVGHLGLILWMLFGGLFLRAHDNPKAAVSQVSLISAQDFAALTAAGSSAPATPQTEVTPPKPTAPETSPAPRPAPKPEARPAQAEPKPADAPKPDTAPDVANVQPLPQADVSGVAPPSPTPPDAQQEAVLVPEPKPSDTPRKIPRVAPMPAPKPPQDAKVSDQAQKSAAPKPSDTATKQQKPKEATAPKEATTRIATEANTSDAPAAPVLAPASSPRPQGRPKRLAAAEPPKPETPQPDKPKPEAAKPEKPKASQEDAIASAVAAAVAGSIDSGASTADAGAGRAPSGPPLTAGEKDGLRLAVQQCWVVDPGSEAANVTVTVGFSLNQDGTVVSGSFKQVSASAGPDSAVRAAYDAARRAIARCGAEGYKLPPEKYDQWRDVEIVFNPEKMRIK